MRRRICDIAEAVLRETGNPAVMWGDCGLLDMIAERAGIRKDRPTACWKNVLDALSKQPGNLVPGKVDIFCRRVRVFSLPEPMSEN